jgi:hypothetical protein
MSAHVTYPELSRAGRLGNQLWEIAATIGLAYDRGQQPRFPLWDYVPFFCVPAAFFTPALSGTPATDLVPHLDPRARAYLQDLRLFELHQDDVRTFFEPSEAAVALLSNIWDTHGFGDLENIISVHVRRGDNVTHPQGYHPLRSWEYYREALQEVGTGDVVVFSDDPAWCREHFTTETGRDVAIFHEGVPRPREYADRVAYETAPVLDWIDLQLMAACDRHVLSNSTYAWWGAFLSDDPGPIYPSNWFGWRVRDWTDASLMFPDHWVQVDDPTMGGV